MALAAPDQYKETGLLANIVGGGSNVIQNAISAAIDRGKQASNLMAGSEANFQTQLNNSINRAQRKNEFDASRADRQDEFVATFGQNEDKLNENQRQFDVNMLFEDKKQRQSHDIALELLEEKKKETTSLIDSRKADTARGVEASQRADKALKMQDRTSWQTWIMNNQKMAEAFAETYDRDENRQERQRNREFRDQLMAKSNDLFAPQAPGAAPGVITVNPNATEEQMRSFVNEAIKSNDPQVLGRASVLADHLSNKPGGMNNPANLETQFKLLDAADAGIQAASAELQKLEERAAKAEPVQIGKATVIPGKSVASVKAKAVQADLINKLQMTIKHTDPKVVELWMRKKAQGTSATAPAPAGTPAATGPGGLPALQNGPDMNRLYPTMPNVGPNGIERP